MNARRVALLVAALSVVGCSSGNNVSFSARAGSNTGLTATRALTISGTVPVTIDDVQLVIRRVRLEQAESSGAATTFHEEELELGPYLIHLQGSQLDSGVLSRVFDADVPTGTYEQIKFEIHKIEDGDVAAHPELAPLSGKSLIVSGTYNGVPFTFTSSLDEEQEREGKFTVGNGTNNITLSIDATKWFTDASGAVLDPSVATNRSQIESNIKASLDVYDDDDEDGRED